MFEFNRRNIKQEYYVFFFFGICSLIIDQEKDHSSSTMFSPLSTLAQLLLSSPMASSTKALFLAFVLVL